MSGARDRITLVNAEALCAILPPDKEGHIHPEYNLFACAPIRKGQCLGHLIFLSEDGESTSVELVASEDLPAQSLRKRFFNK